MNSAAQQPQAQRTSANQGSTAYRPAPTWWIVFLKEVQDLWVGGRALTLLFVFSIIVGAETWVFASNSELSLMPPKEMVFETVSAALSISILISLIIGADSISGERERATLEALLLTPAGRRQIVIGKFLAAMTVWPATLLVALPYMYVLSQGDEVFGQALLWGSLAGTMLAVAFTALGMFVSFFCNSNKTSFFVSIGLYLVVLLPVQLPGRAQTGAAGQFLQWSNPIAANYHFLSKILVNNRTFAEFGSWLASSAVFALIFLVLLMVWAAPGLRLEGGRATNFRRKRGQAAAALLIGALLLGLQALPAHAQTEIPADAQPLSISASMEYSVAKTTDSIFFDTVVANDGAEASPPIIVAMNIINLDKEGDVVDPEDWSPQRTQYIEQLSPGESSTLSWRVNAILDGDYIVYMVAMPEPAGQETTSHAVASPGIHLTVTPFTMLNPSGVLPYTIGGPLLIGMGLAYIYRRRRQGIDAGGA